MWNTPAKRDRAYIRVNHLTRQIDKLLISAQLALNELGSFIAQGSEVGRLRAWDVQPDRDRRKTTWLGHLRPKLLPRRSTTRPPARFQRAALKILRMGFGAVRLMPEDLDLDEACR